jgi:hypothetical protein
LSDRQPIFYAVNVDRVNIDDLLDVGRRGPGAIVRVEGLPAENIVAIPIGSMFVESWTCAFCKGVNRWLLGEAPPNKCRSCGAPERE